MICIIAEIEWRPIWKDHQSLGWFVTGAHFVASYVCFLAARRQPSVSSGKGILRPEYFWPVLGMLMAGLGLYKQLDLQTLLTIWGRQLARAGGWYALRRSYQSIFVCVCLLVGCGAALAGLFFVRGHWRDRGLAYLGLIFLLTFALIRAASFHHVDLFLYHLPGIGKWMSAGLELSGVLLVIFGASLACRRRTRDQAARQMDAPLTQKSE